MPSLPTGTVTFLFSDIEGSTALLKRLGDVAYAELLATHRRLVREMFAGFDGQEIDTQGDAFFYSFPRARDAVAAAVEIQRAHATASWPAGVDVRLRIGLHTGEPAIGDEGYTGLDVVRASRISALGRGGQVLLSDTTRAIVAADLPDGVELRPIGERLLRDIDRPEPLSELVIRGVSVTHQDSDPGSSSDGRPTATEAADVRGWPFDESSLPSWVTGNARRLVSGGDGARDVIEERVMDAITRAFDRRGRSRASEEPNRQSYPATPPKPGSVADEIGRLRELRDAGALSEDQYARAVDKAIDGPRGPVPD